jgi:GT2 family glycosyltransferase
MALRRNLLNNKYISVIIVTYKSSNFIINCLKSILRYNDIGNKLEVIVVDNSPKNDSTFINIKKLFPWVALIKNRSNLGFGAANNVGARKALGEILLFLNPDTELTEPIFYFVYKKFKYDKKLGLLGLKLINKHGKSNLSFGYLPSTLSYFNLIFPMTKLRNLMDVTPKLFYIQGADIFIRKNLFFKIGMFDENIFLFSEESDLIYRIKKIEYNIKFFPEKKIIHLEGMCFDEQVDLNRIEESIKSLVYLIKKHKLDKNILKKLLNVFKIKYFLFRRKIYKDYVIVINKYI